MAKRLIKKKKKRGGLFRAVYRLILACSILIVLGCCLATAQASCSWLMGKAFQFLAAWALQQFLLVTQGDLQVGAGLGAVRGCAAAPGAV